MLGLYDYFSSREMFFYHPTSLPFVCSMPQGPYLTLGHAKPPTALKPHPRASCFLSSSLNNSRAASLAGLQVATGFPEQGGRPRDALCHQLPYGKVDTGDPGWLLWQQEILDIEFSWLSEPCPSPKTLTSGERDHGDCPPPHRTFEQLGSATPASCSLLRAFLRLKGDRRSIETSGIMMFSKAGN